MEIYRNSLIDLTKREQVDKSNLIQGIQSRNPSPNKQNSETKSKDFSIQATKKTKKQEVKEMRWKIA